MFLGSAPPVSAIEVRLRDYVSWRAGDLVIAPGVVEGAARYADHDDCPAGLTMTLPTIPASK